MSIRIMSQVWEREVAGSEQALLLALADHANDDGEHIFPSVARLAWKTGYSKRNIQYLLKKLRQSGVLIITTPSTNKRPTEYAINLEALPLKKPFKVPPALTVALRRETIETFQQICQYCNQGGTKELGPDNVAWHVDRIVPRVRNGEYSRDNMTLACSTCNRDKGAKIAPPNIQSLADRGANTASRGAKSSEEAQELLHPNHKENHKKEPITKAEEKEVARRSEGFEWFFD